MKILIQLKFEYDPESPEDQEIVFADGFEPEEETDAC